MQQTQIQIAINSITYRMSVPGCREGFGDEGGLAVASRRFLFTYNGQNYVWAKHRKFAGDNLSCENTSTGNTVAYYTNKLLPKKLQGTLIVEPQVRYCYKQHAICLAFYTTAWCSNDKRCGDNHGIN